MLINSIELKNFQIFLGRQKLEFSTSKNSNLTVILARNNAGKTTLISALHFLFYGCESEGEEEKFFNTEKLRTIEVGKEIELYVKAKIKSRNRQFTITRSLKGYKRTDEKHPVEIIGRELFRFRHESLRDEIDREEAVIQGYLEEMIPKELFNFFYFKGEELSTRLIEKKDTNIKSGLSQVTYREQIIDTLTTIEKVIRQFEIDFSKSTKATEEHSDRQKRLDTLIDEQDSLRLESEMLKKESEEAEDTYQSFDLEFRKYDRKSARNMEAKGVMLEREKGLEILQENLYMEEQNIKNLIGKSGWIYYIQGGFPSAIKVLDWMEKDIGMPPDFSEGLLSKILKQEKCICGRPVKKKSKESQEIENLKKRCLSANLNNDLYRLMGKFEEKSQIGFNNKLEDYLKTLKESYGKYFKLQEKICEAEKALKLAGKQFDKLADEQAKEKLRLRDEARKEKELISNKFTLKKSEYNSKEWEIDRLREFMRKNRPLDEDTSLLQEGKNFTREINTLILKFGKKITEKFYFELKESVSKIYNEIVTDGSLAIIDHQTLLPAILRDGQLGLQSGGGQAQTLVISYIISLSELRKNINNQLCEFLGLRELDDQCFFMDSVFAPMENAYRDLLAASLPGKMKQLILILSQEQWEGVVSKQLHDKVDDAYLLLLHTPKDEEFEKNHIIFNGKKYEMTKLTSQEICPYTLCNKLN